MKSLCVCVYVWHVWVRVRVHTPVVGVPMCTWMYGCVHVHVCVSVGLARVYRPVCVHRWRGLQDCLQSHPLTCLLCPFHSLPCFPQSPLPLPRAPPPSSDPLGATPEPPAPLHGRDAP